MLRKPLAPRSGREKLIGLVILALTPFFFIHSPLWLLNEAGYAINNLAHVVFFFLLTALVDGRIGLTGARAVLVATLAVFALSLIIETAQAQIGRSASWHDVLRNLLGCWLALFWLHRATPALWLGRWATALLLMAEVALLAQPVVEQFSLARKLPLLASIESERELDYWEASGSYISRSPEQASDGSHSLKVQLGEPPYPGVALKNLPRDWRGFDALLMDIHNPQDHELTLTLRVHDSLHRFGPAALEYSDRFNRRLQLQPGWNTIALPLQDISQAPQGRSMDLGRIQEIRIFSDDAHAGELFYLDHLRLQ